MTVREPPGHRPRRTCRQGQRQTRTQRPFGTSAPRKPSPTSGGITPRGQQRNWRGKTLMTKPETVTALLLAWGRGEESALERLVPLVDADLRQLARRQMAR